MSKQTPMRRPNYAHFNSTQDAFGAGVEVGKDIREHVLYETCDADRPDVICDRNGEVALGLCKVCGKAEAELSEPCLGRGEIVKMFTEKLRNLESHKFALKEWHEKTEWLRKDLQPHELGKHLADVLRERLDQRHVGYWHTHSVYEPKGDFSLRPLLPADVADGWKQEAVYAK